ncbi:hypothetical protein [Actinomadura madurae]|uniref:hypothetical protein n=1 Tax=Actinomadura madurae TaxID=1993 RepID=UPI0020D21D3B|nr:hypothetical protein [Actinomadura madurae]MCQ0009912.1 hypothetical protein [Actinomadura madurae]
MPALSPANTGTSTPNIARSATTATNARPAPAREAEIPAHHRARNGRRASPDISSCRATKSSYRRAGASGGRRRTVEGHRNERSNGRGTGRPGVPAGQVAGVPPER